MKKIFFIVFFTGLIANSLSVLSRGAPSRRPRVRGGLVRRNKNIPKPPTNSHVPKSNPVQQKVEPEKKVDVCVERIDFIIQDLCTPKGNNQFGKYSNCKAATTFEMEEAVNAYLDRLSAKGTMTKEQAEKCKTHSEKFALVKKYKNLADNENSEKAIMTETQKKIAELKAKGELSRAELQQGYLTKKQLIQLKGNLNTEQIKAMKQQEITKSQMNALNYKTQLHGYQNAMQPYSSQHGYPQGYKSKPKPQGAIMNQPGVPASSVPGAINPGGSQNNMPPHPNYNGQAPVTYPGGPMY